MCGVRPGRVKGFFIEYFLMFHGRKAWLCVAECSEGEGGEEGLVLYSGHLEQRREKGELAVLCDA